MAETFENLK